MQTKDRLCNRIELLNSVVENDERISLTVERFGIRSVEIKLRSRNDNKPKMSDMSVPTAGSFIKTKMSSGMFLITVTFLLKLIQ